jgi:hypothetical protein
MSDQPLLFDNPAAHTADPATSHEAAEQHTVSGRRAKHAAIVLELVRGNPGLTAVELWYVSERRQELHEMQEVRRRLTDLLDAGKVRQGAARRCAWRGTSMVTWYAA